MDGPYVESYRMGPCEIHKSKEIFWVFKCLLCHVVHVPSIACYLIQAPDGQIPWVEKIDLLIQPLSKPLSEVFDDSAFIT